MLYVSVGKQQRQTAVQMRTDAPVWEQGYTFLVPNPENDTVQLRIVDQKTEREIGQLTYLLGALLTKPGMEVANQPYQLQKSGGESSIEMSLRLRILKKVPSAEEEAAAAVAKAKEETAASAAAVTANVRDSLASSSTDIGGGAEGLTRSASVRTEPVTSTTGGRVVAELRKQDSRLSAHSLQDANGGADEPLLVAGSADALQSEAVIGGGNYVHRRTSSVTSSAGRAGLGRIQLTLHYLEKRQRLVVVVHRIV